MFRVVETQVASLKKKTAVTTSWISINAKGQCLIIDVDKYAIMHRVQIHARDLRILDPISYPSTILGREQVIVLNLEHIKAIITAEEVLLRDPLADSVTPIVAELKRRLPQGILTCQGQGEEEEHPGVRNDMDTGEENEFPFEFQTLEAICSFLDACTRELETDTYPALDELTSKISSCNLERVCKLKSAMTRLTNRVQKVRDELEQLLDDDDDMAYLYLLRKLAGVCSPVIVSGAPNWYLSSQTIGSKKSRTSRASAMTVKEDSDVVELEMLLEAYFMQIDSTLNKLTPLELFLSSRTVCLSRYSFVAAIFGMNISYTWKEGHGYMFKWVLTFAYEKMVFNLGGQQIILTGILLRGILLRLKQRRVSQKKEREMANQVVKVRRKTIAACMTCLLCNKLLKDATTISECLHTFCRKCIYDKIQEEELECCPICNIDLGCVPLEKLRPDHNLQDVRAKVFPLKRRKVKAPEVLPPVTMPTRRKERSLSSLVVNAPKVSTQTTMTGRRTKAVSRKAGALRGSSCSVEKPVKREEDSMEDHQESASSPETLNKFTQNKRQCTSAEPSQHTNKEAENGGESWDGKLDLWKSLNCLVEVANRTKSFKSNSQGSDSKLEPTRVLNIEAKMFKTKHREDKCKTKVEDEKNSAGPATSETVTPKKLRRIRRKRASGFRDSGVSPQAVLDAAGPKPERRIGPVWFSLVASEDQEGDASLPQIPANYLRIKDGNMPVSFIQKYLTKKLDLTDEAVLYNLVDLWLQTASISQRIPASVGSSAKDFVMVLAYARKAPDQ